MKTMNAGARLCGARVYPILAMALCATALGACAAPTAPTSDEGAANTAGAETAAVDAPSAALDEGPSRDAVASPTPAPEIARITLAADHVVKFVQLDGGVLVTESKRPGMESALQRLGADPSKMTARDVFLALASPGTPMPAGIAKLDTRITRVAGWGRVDVDYGATAPRAVDHDACNNDTFTDSTYGGILPTNQAWLDRHPNEPYETFLYGYQAETYRKVNGERFAFNLKRGNVLQFRAKGCLEVKEGAGQPRHRYWNHVEQRYVDFDPVIELFYRKSGTNSYFAAVSGTVPVGDTDAFEWAFFGDNGDRYDWWFRVSRGQPQDVIDYMRSYL